jgi:hypothetical protein
MSMSDIVIHNIEWGCQSPTLQEIHCLNGNFVFNFCDFNFSWHFQECNHDIKQDLPVNFFIVLRFYHVLFVCY